MPDQIRPRDRARAFTPALADFVDDPLFSKVWERDGLSKRDRSLITVAALVVMYRPNELAPASSPRRRKRTEQEGNQ